MSGRSVPRRASCASNGRRNVNGETKRPPENPRAVSHSSGDRIRTCDLWVMSPASYRAAPPRDGEHNVTQWRRMQPNRVLSDGSALSSALHGRPDLRGLRPAPIPDRLGTDMTRTFATRAATAMIIAALSVSAAACDNQTGVPGATSSAPAVLAPLTTSTTTESDDLVDRRRRATAGLHPPSAPSPRHLDGRGPLHRPAGDPQPGRQAGRRGAAGQPGPDQGGQHPARRTSGRGVCPGGARKRPRRTWPSR